MGAAVRNQRISYLEPNVRLPLLRCRPLLRLLFVDLIERTISLNIAVALIHHFIA